MRLTASLTAAALTLATASPALATSPLEGRWLNPKHSVMVQIGDCGRALCGRVVQASAHSKAKAASAGTATLVGTALLTDLTPGGDGWRGTVFLPDHKIRAAARLTLVSPDRLQIKGCVLAGMLCRSQLWTRVE